MVGRIPPAFSVSGQRVLWIMQARKILTLQSLLVLLLLQGVVYSSAADADSTDVLTSLQFNLPRQTVDKTLEARGFSYEALSPQEKTEFLQELFIRENLLAQQNIIPTELMARLERKLADYREAQLARLVLEVLCDMGMPDFTARAKEIYLARKNENYMLPLRLRVRVLEKSLLQDSEAVLAQLKQIREQIKTGQLDFEAAVQKYSDDSNKKLTGGDSYWFHQGQKPEPVFIAAAALNSDKPLSEIIVYEKKAYLLLFIGRQEATSQSFAEVKDDILKELQDDYQAQQRQQILAELKHRFDTEVTIHPDFK